MFVKTELAMLYQNPSGNNPSRLIELFEAAERLHTNFYHEFLDTEQLLHSLGAAEELATILQAILDTLTQQPLGN